MTGADLSHALAKGVTPWRQLFVENRGQFPAETLYRTLWPSSLGTITADGLVLTQLARPCADEHPTRGHNVRLRFEPSDSNTCKSEIIAGDPAVARASWFHGSDAQHWVTGVPCWGAVRYAGVARGVDVEVHQRSGVLEYDLVVAPDGCLEDLVVVVEGADSTMLTADGSLEMRTSCGTIHQAAPTAWETGGDGNRLPLVCRVEEAGLNRFRFVTQGAHAGTTVTVDPSIVFSTFVEGSKTDVGVAIATDDQSFTYVAGQTESADFPVTPGAFDISKAPPLLAGDAVVFKLSPSGNDLEYATFLGGGTSSDAPIAVQIDALGNATVAGNTSSPDFPTTPGAFSRTLLGSSDGYVARLDPTGSSLLWSTLIGGTGNDTIYDLVIDATGRPVVAGETSSTDLPVTASACQSVKPNPVTFLTSGFVARFVDDAHALDYCTYFGGTSEDRIRAVSTDASGAMYIAGRDSSGSTFPSTPGVLQSAPKGSGDAFVAKLADSGNVEWATLLGGTDVEEIYDMGIDAEGQPIVAGQTSSFDFPTTPGAFDPSFNGFTDCFVSKLNTSASGLIWSTRLGGADSEEFWGLALATDGTCHVLSNTRSSNFPVSPDAIDPTLNVPGMFAPHVARLSADGSQLLYGTFFGGPWAFPHGIAVDAAGRVHFTGGTLNAGFPTTAGALDTSLTGSNGLFVTVLDLSPWSDLGQALPGPGNMVPVLSGQGALQPGSSGVISLSAAPQTATCALVVGLAPLSAPFKGGVLVPVPQFVAFAVTDSQGSLALSWSAWPPGLPAGTKIYMQAWIHASTGTWCASNALLAWTPVIEN